MARKSVAAERIDDEDSISRSGAKIEVSPEKLVDRIIMARAGHLYEPFADGDASADPFRLRETAGHARSCLANNVASLSRACAVGMSGEHGLLNEEVAGCFYGIAQMCDFLEAINDVHDNATFQCIKREVSAEVPT